jgi:hypothetical protein
VPTLFEHPFGTQSERDDFVMNPDSHHINQMYSLLAQGRNAHAQQLLGLDDASSNQVDTLADRADDMLHQAAVHHGKKSYRAAHSALSSAASHIGVIGRLLSNGQVRPMADSIASAYRRQHLG